MRYLDNLQAAFRTSGHKICKKRVSMNNVMGEIFRVTYSLHSAPVCNSGHIMYKRRVSVNIVIGEVILITYRLHSGPVYTTVDTRFVKDEQCNG